MVRASLPKMFKLVREASQCLETLQSLGNPRGLRSIALLAIDFNRTHATNSARPGHAQFHVGWQSVTIALLAGVELILIWSHSLSEIDVFTWLVFSPRPPRLVFCPRWRRSGGTGARCPTPMAFLQYE